ncbi:hypothetical protein SD77_2736 [Bacillus badius]|uniref:Ribose 5-phosphate isomerase B n=1 Tax=Bacillus badius TaxID=1455 RepID=A0ABR5APZ5_BACBA|nr:hypothetical protein SD78_4393 [Bacillus badius]KIL75896.1 hypothetical protein SD77_2736 [Bacillus badius]
METFRRNASMKSHPRQAKLEGQQKSGYTSKRFFTEYLINNRTA